MAQFPGLWKSPLMICNTDSTCLDSARCLGDEDMLLTLDGDQRIVKDVDGTKHEDLTGN